MPSFLGGKSHSAFGQPAFFLAGNRMATVPFEKGAFFFLKKRKKSLACLAKRFSSTEVMF